MNSSKAAKQNALDVNVTSAQLADSLDQVGARTQVMETGLHCPIRGIRIAGRARTIRFVPEDRDVSSVYHGTDPYGDFIAFIDQVEDGDVVVVATGGDGRTSYWGELFSAAAMARGAVGVVCDGMTRDSARVRALGFPIFSPGFRPIDYRARMRVIETDTPVQIAGVLVRPGDLICADDDGIVVVPKAVEDAAVALANERASTEDTVLDELKRGRSLREVWDEFKVL